MNAVTLRAHFDGKSICLDEPYELAPDAQLVVTVLASDNATLSAERDAWATLATKGIAAAYGPDEPEYTVDMLKERNPAYEGR